MGETDESKNNKIIHTKYTKLLIKRQFNITKTTNQTMRSNLLVIRSEANEFNRCWLVETSPPIDKTGNASYHVICLFRHKHV